MLSFGETELSIHRISQYYFLQLHVGLQLLQKNSIKKSYCLSSSSGGAGSKEEMFFVKSSDGSDLTVFWFHGSK